MKIFSMISSIGIGGDAMWVRINNISCRLEKNGHNISLYHYIIKINRNKHKSILLNTSIYENEYGVDITKVCNPVSIFSIFLKDIKTDKYDLIYGNTFMGAIIPILTKKYHKLPVIVDVHGILTEEYKLKSTKKSIIASTFNYFLEYVCFRYADGFFCVSNKMIEYLKRKKNIPLKKMHYVTNGVDLDFFKLNEDNEIKSLRKSLCIADKFVFGYIGGSQEWQGLDNYLETIKQIKQNDIAFLFVGTGKQGKENNAIFISSVDRSQIALYYSVCDVLVLPRPSCVATEVAAPTKFAEYLAMGKPILATEVGDAGKLVQLNKNGIVIKDNSVSSLKKGILDFVAMDSKKITEMGDKSRKLAEDEFNWEKVSVEL